MVIGLAHSLFKVPTTLRSKHEPMLAVGSLLPLLSCHLDRLHYQLPTNSVAEWHYVHVPGCTKYTTSNGCQKAQNAVNRNPNAERSR